MVEARRAHDGRWGGPYLLLRRGRRRLVTAAPRHRAKAAGGERWPWHPVTPPLRGALRRDGVPEPSQRVQVRLQLHHHALPALLEPDVPKVSAFLLQQLEVCACLGCV